MTFTTRFSLSFLNFKLTYQSFKVKESEDYSYDAMTVYEDVGKEEEIVLTFDFLFWECTIYFMTFTSPIVQCKFACRVSGNIIVLVSVP